MKAVQIQQFGTPDVLQVVTLPEPEPAPGEILIKVESASVNYSDIARRSNATYPFPTPLPFIPGSEVAGTVAALGAGVEGLPIGTPVFALAGQGSNGYAQYVTTPASQVIPIPPGVSMDQAAGLPVAGTSALMLLREVAHLQPGESVFIPAAAGGLGCYAVQLAKVLGAGLVIGGTSSPAKFDKVRSFGADHVVDYTQSAWVAQVRELTGGQGVNVMLEMNGGALFTQSVQCLAPFGRLVVYGMASGQALTLDADLVKFFFYEPSLNQSIHVFNLGLQFGLRPQVAAQAMADFIGYVASGHVKVAVDTVLPLAQAAEAHRLVESRRSTGKIILKPWLEA
ncbi:MAG: zinc-binding dehydrogenase [Anaerolineae bacterium]